MSLEKLPHDKFHNGAMMLTCIVAFAYNRECSMKVNKVIRRKIHKTYSKATLQIFNIKYLFLETTEKLLLLL